METKKPMLWARVDPDLADAAQALADEHYDGNVSMFVRQAVKRFIRAFALADTDAPPVEDADREMTAVPA